MKQKEVLDLSQGSTLLAWAHPGYRVVSLGSLMFSGAKLGDGPQDLSHLDTEALAALRLALPRPYLRKAPLSLAMTWVRLGSLVNLSKLSFTGKGYRIRKYRGGALRLNFGHSHRLYLVWGGLVFRKVKKQRFIL
jgi:hypothetical protein